MKQRRRPHRSVVRVTDRKRSRQAANIARLISWSLHRWYGLPRLDRDALSSLKGKLECEVRRQAISEAYRDLKKHHIWWGRYLRIRAALVEIASDRSEEGEVFRHMFAELSDHAGDLKLLEIAAGLPKMVLLDPPSPEERALDRFDYRTGLVGGALLRLFKDTYPNVPLESEHPKLAVEASQRCYAMSLKRWGPGVLFIAITAIYLGVEPPDDVEDVHKSAKRLARSAG